MEENELKETLWECLNKHIPTEFDTSDSTCSPPPKRPRIRRLLDFRTAEEIEELKYVATEVVELKDYVEWFMSTSITKTHILSPKYYCECIFTLDSEAKANVIIHFFNYVEWYSNFVALGRTQLPCEITETGPTEQEEIKIYAELALPHFKSETNEDYECTRHRAIVDCKVFVHLNFFARLKVSESRRESGPEELFFAEVGTQNKRVTKCCIVDPDILVHRSFPSKTPSRCWSLL